MFLVILYFIYNYILGFIRLQFTKEFHFLIILANINHSTRYSENNKVLQFNCHLIKSKSLIYP
jgi:hypothetical protein